MSKWKCEICGSSFDNFHAQGFDNKIHCPLCYFKRLSGNLQVENQQLKSQKNEALNYIKNYNSMELRYQNEEVKQKLDIVKNILNKRGSNDTKG